MLEDGGVLGHQPRRFLEMVARLAQAAEAEVDPTQRVDVGAVVGLERDRALDELERLLQLLAAIGPHVAEVVERSAVLGIDRERALERVLRLGDGAPVARWRRRGRTPGRGRPGAPWRRPRRRSRAAGRGSCPRSASAPGSTAPAAAPPAGRWRRRADRGSAGPPRRGRALRAPRPARSDGGGARDRRRPRTAPARTAAP